MGTKKSHIESFNFKPGFVLAGKYKVVGLLGAGWEGEVYKVREISTGIDRAAKIFFPQRNPKNKSGIWYAKKLHKLRHCSIVIQYQTQEMVEMQGEPIYFLISDYVDGIILSDFLKQLRGKRLQVFPALHLLYALATGIESIHQAREYHGDLHFDNVIVCKYGLGFELKLLDFSHWSHPRAENIADDVFDMIKIFYIALGGSKYYSSMPQEVKGICRGLRKSLVRERFKTAGQLREYLESLDLM